MRKTTILCGLVLLIGVGLFLGTRTPTTTATNNNPRSFVVTFLVTSDGKPRELSVRAVKATGEWKETLYKFDGGVTIRAADAEGQYVMSPGDKARQWVSINNPEMDAAFRSAAFLESHPNFVRKERVAGFDTFVHRGEFPGSTIEEALSPQLGLAALRTIITIEGAPTINREALKVEFREVADSEVGLVDVPTEFALAERKVEALRQSGLGDAANALLRSIGETRSRGR